METITNEKSDKFECDTFEWLFTLFPFGINSNVIKFKNDLYQLLVWIAIKSPILELLVTFFLVSLEKVISKQIDVVKCIKEIFTCKWER